MSQERPNCGCKVGRNAEHYGLAELDTELYHHHQNEGASLRDLEEYVNKRILENALANSDLHILGGIDDIYHKLIDDTASVGERVEVRDRLQRVGVDIDRVESDFVTYQTIRTHLRHSLNVETGVKSSFNINDAQTKARRLQSRSEAVITQALDRLRNSGELATGDLDVVVSVRVTCDRCGDSCPLNNLLNQERCRCGGEYDTDNNNGRRIASTRPDREQDGNE